MSLFHKMNLIYWIMSIAMYVSSLVFMSMNQLEFGIIMFAAGLGIIFMGWIERLDSEARGI